MRLWQICGRIPRVLNKRLLSFEAGCVDLYCFDEGREGVLKRRDWVFVPEKAETRKKSAPASADGERKGLFAPG